MEWLKIWNFDKESKHVASFLMDISNTKLLDAWMKKKHFGGKYVPFMIF
jgi:hypothetical protein